MLSSQFLWQRIFYEKKVFTVFLKVNILMNKCFHSLLKVGIFMNNRPHRFLESGHFMNNIFTVYFVFSWILLVHFFSKMTAWRNVWLFVKFEVQLKRLNSYHIMYTPTTPQTLQSTVPLHNNQSPKERLRLTCKKILSRQKLQALIYLILYRIWILLIRLILKSMNCTSFTSDYHSNLKS